MTVKVYDFKTGKLCKMCEGCKYWKELNDFPEMEGSKHDVGPVCSYCVSEEVDFTFKMDDDDEVI